MNSTLIKMKRLEIHWSTLNAHRARRKATLYSSPAVAAKEKSLVTDTVTDVLIRFRIIVQRSKGAHYFHRVVGLVVINIRQWYTVYRPWMRRRVHWHWHSDYDASRHAWSCWYDAARTPTLSTQQCLALVTPTLCCDACPPVCLPAPLTNLHHHHHHKPARAPLNRWLAAPYKSELSLGTVHTYNSRKIKSEVLQFRSSVLQSETNRFYELLDHPTLFLLLL